MYIQLYNRLTGWLWAGLGVWGLLAGSRGEYVQMTTLEGVLCICVGVLAMTGARVSRRNGVAVAGLVTCLFIAWTVIPSTTPVLGTSVVTATPFESILRFLTAVWGLYCVGMELWKWRGIIRQQS